MDTDVNSLRAVWTEPNRVHFGAGRINELPGICLELGMSRPLLVTDPGLSGLSILRHAVAACEGHGLCVTIFAGVKFNPSLRHVAAGLTALRDGKHDGIIAFGGGTAIDVAKVIGLLARDPGKARQLDLDLEEDGATPRAVLPVVAVPTTAGSGAEVRPYAIITDPSNRRKRVLHDPGLLPDTVIADPVLTTELPPILTAATGMNAMAHNLEAYCAPGFDPSADGMAAEGVRLIRAHLPDAFRNGHDLVARAMMMAAAALGGMVFRKGLGAIQALTDPIAAVCDVHHGLATAVLTPYVLVHNRPAIEPRIKALAAYVGLDEPGFDSFLTCLLTLRSELGIPHTLQGLGMAETRIDEFVAAAVADPFAASNPRPLTPRDVHTIYIRAFTGNLDGTVTS